MNFQSARLFPLSFLFVIGACSGVDDPFSPGSDAGDEPDAGEPSARGGSKGGHDRGGSGGAMATGGASGHVSDAGEGGASDAGAAGSDDPDAGTGGAEDPGGGTSSGGSGGSCSSHGGAQGGCGHAGSGADGGLGGGAGVGGGGGNLGGAGLAGGGFGGSSSGSGGTAGCSHHGGAGAGGMASGGMAGCSRCSHCQGGAGMAGAGMAGAAGMAGGGGTASMVVQALIFPFSCDRTHPYEVEAVVDGASATGADLACAWTFDDGGTSSSCAGDHTFASAGFHSGTVVVRHVPTGAVASDSMGNFLVVDPISLSIAAEAPKCGLSISYVTTKLGGRTGGHTGIVVEPFENVVTEGPLPPSGTVEVSAPGVYVVRALREEETTGPICGANASTKVTVTACP